jgi:hypothetical protein
MRESGKVRRGGENERKFGLFLKGEVDDMSVLENLIDK